MIFPQARKNNFFTILFTLSLTILITACSTDENFSADQGGTASTTEADTGINDNSPAVIRGVNSGSVTEDLNPDIDGLLKVSGQLTIADSDIGESAFLAMTSTGRYGTLNINSTGNWSYTVKNNLPAIQNLGTGSSLVDSFSISSVDGTGHLITISILGVNEANQPAIISGTDTGNVTEDSTFNSGDTLFTSGILTIIDNDNGENIFFSESKNTNYGTFFIFGSGFWNYSVNNGLSTIQNLASGQSITESISVNSIDGTMHTVVITIHGMDEPNKPPIIFGTDSGSVTEDIDPDNDGLLEASGKLNILDADSGEASFQTAGLAGNFGNLFIDTSGNWSYSTANDQSVIQNLGSNDRLIESFNIYSADNTSHTILITINGADETNTTADITLSWTLPNEREDSTPLTLPEIAGYIIYYGTTSGQYNNSVTINSGNTTSHLFKDFAIDTYYFVMTTLDTVGRESQQSPEAQKTN